jgi:hypothetical protein
MVVEENHNYSEVIRNSAMPYLNSLASQYGLATQYFANTIPQSVTVVERTLQGGLNASHSATIPPVCAPVGCRSAKQIALP